MNHQSCTELESNSSTSRGRDELWFERSVMRFCARRRISLFVSLFGSP